MQPWLTCITYQVVSAGFKGLHERSSLHVKAPSCAKSSSASSRVSESAGVPDQSQCPVGSTAFQLVLNSFGSTGRFGLTCSHEAPSGVVGRALLAAH